MKLSKGALALTAVATVIGAVAVTAGAFAGECPADRVVKTGGQTPGAMMPKNVTDNVLGSIVLGQHPVAIQDRTFRLRRLEIAPGGEVPWHSHEDRPAIIYVVAGTVTEYASTCTQPIVHHAGDTSVEQATVKHWWKNTGDQTAVLISADLLHEAADPHIM